MQYTVEDIKEWYHLYDTAKVDKMIYDAIQSKQLSFEVFVGFLNMSEQFGVE